MTTSPALLDEVSQAQYQRSDVLKYMNIRDSAKAGNKPETKAVNDLYIYIIQNELIGLTPKNVREREGI